MNMKKLIIVLGIVFSMVNFAQAQGGRQMGTPAERADRQITQLESLKLSSDQKAQLKEIFIWSTGRMDSLRKVNPDTDFQEIRQKMMPMQAETSNKVNAILSDAQKKAYEAILEERLSRMRGQ